jgi:aminoglycoside/choline kinase family phosphotransferase
MDAPPQHEDVRPFVAVAEWLAEAGLTAPEILARDMEQGLLLLGDFGDWRLREILDDDPSRESELYELATDVLVHLHQHDPMPGLPPHGLDQWLEELKLFTDWYCPAVGLSVECESYRDAWAKVLQPVAADGLGPVTVLRDYHAENVMLVKGREGRGALRPAGFPGRPCRPPGVRLSIGPGRRPPRRFTRDRARDARTLCRSDRQGRGVQASYWALAAQRNTRILGVFTRLWKRDNKAHYTQFQPRMWGLLERDLARPGLEPVREWFDANVGPDYRVAPWKEAA